MPLLFSCPACDSVLFAVNPTSSRPYCATCSAEVPEGSTVRRGQVVYRGASAGSLDQWLEEYGEGAVEG